jgi:acetyl esterase/lipase
MSSLTGISSNCTADPLGCVREVVGVPAGPLFTGMCAWHSVMPGVSGNSMSSHSSARRNFLRQITALSAAGLSGAKLVAATGKVAYDPAGRFELKVSEIEFRRNQAGRMLMARIYQPVGSGPFPTLLDLHGGAWNFKDRSAEEPMDRALASSGVLVVAIDMTLAPEAPYPACIQDANYAVRWLKAKAATWNGDPSRIGIYGSSSGGYVGELLGMRPHDPRYNAIPLKGASKQIDATVTYIATRSPISNPLARFENAADKQRDTMVGYSKTFFNPWETIVESNPQLILDRKEKVRLPALLIMQGDLDDNVLPAVQEKFAKSYNAAGGTCEYRLFEKCVHQWVAKEGPQTDRARATVKEFIARQMTA